MTANVLAADKEAFTARLTIAAAGDTTAHGVPADLLGDPGALDDVRRRLGEPDLFIFNHEGALTASGGEMCAPFGHQSVFHSDPGFADHMALGQRNVAVLANNHILDCGGAGVLETVAAFAERGFATVGAGSGVGQACQPYRTEVAGNRVAVLAFLAHEAERFALAEDATGAATWEACGGAQRVRTEAENADLVIVSLHLHLSPSWTEFAAPEHVELARGVLEAGADIVIGHGPHVPQGVLVAGHGVALLSLGNFVFSPGYDMVDGATRSIVARISVSQDALAVDLVPFRLTATGIPTAPGEADALRIIRDLIGLSSRLGTMLGSTREGARLVVPRRPGSRAASP